MTQNNSAKKALIVTGSVLIIVAFANIATTINNSVNSINGSSCIVSAFAG